MVQVHGSFVHAAEDTRYCNIVALASRYVASGRASLSPLTCMSLLLCLSAIVSPDFNVF